jgi:FAD/FMN-containing dehydrogenase
VSAAVSRHQEETSGLRGLLARATAKLRTQAFNLAHGGAYLLSGSSRHEGRYEGGRWSNWTEDYAVVPTRYACPRDEETLRRIVADSRQVRVVGGGHSFNDSPLCADTLISLDALDRVLAFDPLRRTIRVQAGVRLRDLNKVLAQASFALPVLGSTDAQSLGGLIATDLHGTGRDHGFLSEQILGLRVVLADGDARDVGPGDPLFHAVMGGLGAVGVVTEVELQLVDTFNFCKRTAMVDRATTEAQLDALILQHDHQSYYYIGGASRQEAVRAHTWDHTQDPVTEGWDATKAAQELSDFGISAFLPELAEALVQLDEDHVLSNLAAPDHQLVMPAQRGFGRKLFYRHDEIELAVPFEAYHDCLNDVLTLLRDEDYFSIVEVRFTPDRSQALIGPGVGRRSAWIELATPLSQPRGLMYARVEAILRAYGGRPHLGKKTTFTHHELLEVYGERFTAFQAVRSRVDPTGKLLNPFTRRLFGG